ncbi:MAG: HAD-IG family 5'-nucleotidase [Myxococcales bacterium]|nr:HAD-IG family 5'-nucleotidase [Myxococcales bacterium]MCB9708972.1 HAD-IG family 5'-nucleotidase [Myxococcales bacterium]
MIELPPPQQRIFCNRTLNFRSIKAVGFDMDYTLIHYHTEEWERRAYLAVRKRLAEDGFPVKRLQFDPRLIKLGLIIDTELGNVVKADRFGYIKRACHGTTPLNFDEQRAVYSRIRIDLADPRWQFMNTLFALSEACLYSQMVDLLDKGKLSSQLGYSGLYKIVRSRIDEAHMEGSLKAEIINRPELFVELNAEVPLALLDIKYSGKKLLLITNSEWNYTQAMMRYAFDRFLPGGMTWRDLFDLVIVEARKPDFFNIDKSIFEVVDEEHGLLRPFVGRLRDQGVYLGGSASLVEEGLGLSGEEILYIGDHLYADVLVSKNILRWRTALIVRELEQDLESNKAFQAKHQTLRKLMLQKELLEHEYSLLRLDLQRQSYGYGPQPKRKGREIRRSIQGLRAKLLALDGRIAPLAREASQLTSPVWGPLMRAGNDKSYLARQIERYADIYTSRLSNLVAQTPFVYLRAPGGALPHD